MSSIAIVGAGPRGVGVLERLAASVPELHPDELDVHLVDPYPAGAGRIWRRDQSPLLAMNSMAADITMFTDDTVVCDGPIVAGPSFWEWAGRTDPDTLDPALAAELRAVSASTFPSRRLQSEYLGWVLRDVIARLPAGMRVHLHRATAVGLVDEGDAQVLRLDGGRALRVDAVVLASGHLDATPTPDELALAARAAERGLRYLPPEQTTDTDLSVVEPGETVLVRGLGLAFVDLVVLLFEGRGGRFVPDDPADREGLRYVPSGAEPHLVAGSPRGSLYHAKPAYQLRGGRPPLPRFFGPEQTGPVIAAGEPIELYGAMWPLMAKELAWGWYHELFLGHPERVRVPWAEFVERYSAAAWDSPEMVALLGSAVPDPVDRLDLDAMDEPSPAWPRRTSPRCSRSSAPGSPRTCASTPIPRTRRTWARSWRCCRSTGRCRSCTAPGSCRPGPARSTWAAGRASSTPRPAARPGSGCASCSRCRGPGSSTSSGPACGSRPPTEASGPAARPWPVPSPSAPRSWSTRACPTRARRAPPTRCSPGSWATARRSRTSWSTATARCCATPG
jgi:hypothetical protein